MLRATLAALVLSACKFNSPDPANVDAKVIDAAIVDALDAPDVDALDGAPPIDARACFGTYVNVCLSALPSAPRVFTANTTIDTGAGGTCADTGSTAPGLCVVTATAFTIDPGVIVRGTGAKPLVLLATDGGIDIKGTIDVASKRASTTGAGRGTGTCDNGTIPTGDGGGQGGSFGGLGGNGGDGPGASTPGTRGNTTVLAAGELRGGCDAAAGAGGAPGAGGAGGGSVLLIATAAITIDGLVNASGAAGLQATGSADGGGGGGSGGAIVLDGATVAVAGIVFANGGGGGEGSGGGGNDGAPGNDPIPPAAGVSGNGASDTGGNGGTGSLGGNGGLANTGATGGGGGGGGGAGVVRSIPLPTINGGTVSPTATAPP